MSLTARFEGAALNATWRINVAGRVYGPYTGHQISTFASVGRLAPHSIVQAGEAGPWITAIDDPVLAQLFNREGAAKPVPSQPASPAGARDAGLNTAAEEAPSASNFVIITELKTAAAPAIHATLQKFGEAYRLNGSVWLLRASQTAATIRNELTQLVGRTDSLFVVDTTQGRSAWFNMGPEADAHIRAVWNKRG